MEFIFKNPAMDEPNSDFYETPEHPMCEGLYNQLCMVRGFQERNGHTYQQYVQDWGRRYEKSAPRTPSGEEPAATSDGASTSFSSKPRLLVLFGTPRSGTQNFCNECQKTRLEGQIIRSYYEVFNPSYYDGTWDTFYERYGTVTKLETLFKIIDTEHRAGVLTVVKFFANQEAEPETIISALSGSYDVRYILLTRNLIDVYNSLYRAIVKNDWTSKRITERPLALSLDVLRGLSPVIKHIIDSKVHEKYHTRCREALQSSTDDAHWTELHFDNYCKWTTGEFEELFIRLWSTGPPGVGEPGK